MVTIIQFFANNFFNEALILTLSATLHILIYTYTSWCQEGNDFDGGVFVLL